MGGKIGKALKLFLKGSFNLILWGGSYVFVFEDLFSDGISLGSILLSICWGLLILASFDSMTAGLKYLLNLDDYLSEKGYDPNIYIILVMNAIIVVIYMLTHYISKY